MNIRNKVQLIGNCGRDPEVMVFDNGNKKASFTLATTETYKNKSGEKISETEWHTIVIFGKLADVAEKYVKKGMLLVVDGKIKTRSYVANSGETKYITEIVCHAFEMLGNKPSEQKTESNDPLDDIEDEIHELPF